MAPPPRIQRAPAAGARREGQEADALAAVAEREDEESRAAILAGDRVAHHRAVAVVDLRFLARGRDDHRVRVGCPRPSELDDEPAHAAERRSRDRRRDSARSPSRGGPEPGPARSPRGTARRRWRWVRAEPGAAISAMRWGPRPVAPSRWTPLWPDLAGAPTAGAPAPRARPP